MSSTGDGMFRIRFAVSGVSYAFHDARLEPGSRTSLAISTLVRNSTILETKRLTRIEFEIIQSQIDRAINSLQLAGYVKEG